MENEGLGIVQEPVSSQMKEETTNSLHARAVGALATSESFACTNREKRMAVRL
jgi:hypothetical protein